MHWKKCSYRKEFNRRIISALPLSSLERIEETNNLTWKETGKEFFLDGELYDIVKTEIVGTKKFYYVLKDEAEKKLVTEFNHVLKSHQNNSRQSRLDLKIQLAVFTFPSEPSIDFSISPEEIKYFVKDSDIISLPRNIIPNPPRIFTA